MSGSEELVQNGAEVSLPPLVSNGAEVRLAVARARWLDVQNELLRGVTHALSNRIATVAGAAYMLEHNDVTAAQAAESLRQETERMEAMLQLLRLLPARDDTGFEPVVPGDIAKDAIALHAHHAELRDVAVVLESSADVLPVWVEPHAFLQAVLLALTAAKRAAFPHALCVHVHIGGNADVTTIAVHPESDDYRVDALRTAMDAAAADSCLHSARGTVAPRSDGGCTITLPTLPAVRRAGR